MRVLFITDLIPIDNNENCAKALIPIIKELQFNNIVDVIRPNFTLNSLIRGKIIKKNGTYNYDSIKIQNINFHTPFLFPYKKIDISNYDKIIAHMPSGILFAENLLKQAPNYRPQVVYAVHQSDIQVLTSLKYSIYFRQQIKKAYTNCDKIICRSPHLKDKLLKILPTLSSKTEIKSSKLPKKYFISEEEMYAKIVCHENIKFITVANLIKRKNIHLLLKSISTFKDKNFLLEVVGDGKELNALKRLSNKLQLNNVTFTGKLTKEEVLSHLRQSNVFILPSINETLGLAYLEAFACGCLCIGTKGTGIDGIFFDNINCFLCEPTINGISKVLDKVFSLTEEDFKNLLQNRSLSDF